MFIDQLDEPVELLTELVSHKPDWFITDFRNADELLDAKDNVLDPIKAFLKGNQRSIFENACAFMRTNQSNIAYLPARATDAVAFALEDAQIFRGNKTQQLGKAVTELEQQLQSLIDAERVAATNWINDYWQLVPGSKAYQEATEAAQLSVTRCTETVLDLVAHETQIPVLRNQANHFADTVYPGILDELAAASPVAMLTPQQGSPTGDDPEPDSAPVKHTVSIKRLALPGTGQILETTDDVDDYLEKLRATLLATINDNKRITL